MKIRSLTFAAVALASSAAFLAPAPASAWECPANLTRPYYFTNPATGGQGRLCVPDLNCETCLGIVR